MSLVTLEQVARLVDELSLADQQTLVDRLTQRLQQASAAGAPGVQSREPQDPYGIWRDRFPDDLDIDGLLHDIRHEWQSEWPELFHP